MLNVLLWYLSLTVLGLLAFPLTYRVLGKLPDRGYTVSRAFGLLLWAFSFWLLGSYGVLANDSAGLIFALLILVAASYWAWRSVHRGEMASWMKKNLSLLVSVEVLFLLAFAAMALLRASNPNIIHTEQPMELAFLNAILRSPSMPPHDPWLSGYSISYYYFGYVMVAMLAKVSGAVAGVAFNLGLAMVFGMAALGAYGLAYNLLALKRPDALRANRVAAFLAPVFVLLLGNVEGFLEILHAQHLFWEVDAAGNSVSAFWSWLNIRELVLPPIGEPAWQPRNYNSGGWWWWRASRVINDLNFMGFDQELIDEFPAFSFVLGDLHPHVLSMPIVFLAQALGFNMFMGGASQEHAGLLFGLRLRGSFLFSGILVLGGLAFLNIWDFPIYLLLFALLYTYRRAQEAGWAWQRVEDFLALMVTLGAGGVLAYLPFYLGFSSQAGGILPNLLNPTRGTHLWVMFATLLIPIFAYLFFLWKRKWYSDYFTKGFLLAIGLVAFLWIFSNGLAWAYANILTGSGLGQEILSGLGAPDLKSLFAEAFLRRVTNYGGWLTLTILLGLLFGLLWRDSGSQQAAGRKQNSKAKSAQGGTFALLLALFAGLLVLAPEFVYLRDNFGTRMNTVFKFYMQAWLIWGVVAAYAVAILLSELRASARVLAIALFTAVFAIGIVYAAYAFPDVARRAEGQALQLDGTQYLAAEELAAIAWLQQAPLRPLVEAVGGSYNPSYARYATHSGQLGVMGWPGHESQWRGGSVDYAPRIGEIEALYSTADWGRAEEILQKYGVGYLVIGPVERSSYSVNEAKFEQYLEAIFQNDLVTIYLVP